ncbi:uncharacterized protein EI90DRAFT_3066874 [Cantharellus anzutake]|uniref:uncharacterized protein n=1 Tax=Cantharellus anzutake TaxID=1750568 RepID=UPI0019072B52|nr:uncharacterized protein EI90DRAFT_3066874 [Cantharellus anzutake]KAF8327745.1 hypothetical protein EI90DRAFT_3066874 [Cantharellus anzutake]
MASEYSQLSHRLRKRIDRVFDEAINATPRDKRVSDDSEESGRPYKRRKTTQNIPMRAMPDEEAGGFLLDADEAAGFLIDDPTSSRTESHENGTDVKPPAPYIRLTDIPTALQRLDLPPDDEDVLATFRSAAFGWGDSSNGEHGVKLDDWREVCAVLLIAHEQSPSQASDVDMAGESDDGGGFILEDDGDAEDDQPDESIAGDEKDGDFLIEDEEDEDEVAQDDSDYEADLLASVKSRRKTRRHARRASSASSDGTSEPMTARQKGEARKAFGLFFPDIPLIRMSYDQIVEMLDAFSTSADKSVSLADFERMAMVARLV